MEGDILGGSQERRLQDEEIHVFAQGFEVVMLGQSLGFRGDGEGDEEVILVEFGANGGDEVGDVVFGIQFLQVYVQTVHF